MSKQLVIYLVGRICVVTKGQNLWAVFLDAGSIPSLGLRKHAPLMSVPMSMVASQTTADKALATSATFVNRLKGPGPLMDSMGVWPLSGWDITIGGVKTGTGVPPQIDDLSDLNAIVSSIDKKGKFKFETRILDKTPSKVVLARLRLPSAATVIAVTEDKHPRTFIPGKHTQKVATYVKCQIPFANDAQGPTLNFRAFKSKGHASYKLTGLDYAEVPVMMSNLCNCVKEVPKKGAAGQLIDDPEFGVYYGLLRKPRPSLKQMALPQVPGKFQGVFVPECYEPSRVTFGPHS